MRAGRPSRTAEYMALFRALESVARGRERLFEDPYARVFLTGRLRTAAAVSALPGLGRLIPGYIDRRYPGPRLSGVVRTRLIDDATRAALSAGATQLVILGAGYDTRAYRLSEARTAEVYEVDHPSTQSAKRSRLEPALGTLPDHVRFVPVDFDTDDVGERLAAAGLGSGAPTVFLWEGVVGYLELDAIDLTFRWMAATGAPGSQVVFTYIDSKVLSDAGGEQPWVTAVGRAGEPFKTGFEPPELGAFLAERGLELLSDESTAAAAPRFGFGAAAIPDFYRVAMARVSER